MEPARVPQHLEVEDVLAWGLTATDLLWLIAGLAVAWWIYLHVAAPLPVRAGLAAPPALVGLLLGPARLGDRSLRAVGGELLAFLFRPRQSTYGGGA